MSLYKIRDKSFDERQFADVLEYLDAYVLAQMLADLDMKYEIVSGGQNYAGNIHQIVVFSRAVKKGFKLTLYENQSLRIKGAFHVQAERNEIDLKSIAEKLKNNKFIYDFKMRDGKVSYAVKLTDRLQYIDIIDIFNDQLP